MCVINRQNIILKYGMRGHFRYNSLRRNLHCLNGHLTDGKGEDPLGQRVYRTMKRIRQEILYHCSVISVYLV